MALFLCFLRARPLGPGVLRMDTVAHAFSRFFPGLVPADEQSIVTQPAKAALARPRNVGDLNSNRNQRTRARGRLCHFCLLRAAFW